jgi:hypothetical protein
MIFVNCLKWVNAIVWCSECSDGHQCFTHVSCMIYLPPSLLVFQIFCFCVLQNGYICFPLFLSNCLHFCLSAYLACLPACTPVYLLACLYTCTSAYMSVCLSIYLLIYLSACLLIYLSTCLSVCLSIYLFCSLSVCLPVSLCLSICSRASDLLPCMLTYSTGDTKQSIHY